MNCPLKLDFFSVAAINCYVIFMLLYFPFLIGSIFLRGFFLELEADSWEFPAYYCASFPAKKEKNFA